jgi:hypothetical protein
MEMKMKPKLRPVEVRGAACQGCDLLGKIELCRGKGPGVPCVLPAPRYTLLHFKIVGEVPSTR